MLVAAGQRSGSPGLAAAGADIVLPDALIGKFVDGIPVQQTLFGEFRLPVILKHQIFLHGEVQNQAVLLPVRGNAGHAVHEAKTGGLVENIHTVYGDPALCGLFQARDDLHKLGLAVAVDTSDTHDLTLADGEVQAPEDFHTPVVHTVQVLHLQDHIAGHLLRLIHLERHLAAHHHAGELILGHGFHIHGVNVLAQADDGAVVGGGLDLLELMGNEDDALAV